MRPLRFRLQEARNRIEVPWEVLERDYLLSWVLAGISETKPLSDCLVFKGGTALKKCYFGDYRFSEDLDFSAKGDHPAGSEMEAAMKDACARAVELLDPYAPVEIVCTRHIERDPHPSGQEAFDIRGKLPYHREPYTKVIVEISVDERILKPVSPRKILHEYGEPLRARIATYSLEEVIAEKLRALLQHARIIERRGWDRSRARDYYDLWRILRSRGQGLDLDGFSPFLREKCAVKDVAFSGAESFFDEDLLEHVRKTWKDWLEPLVCDLPAYEAVVDELRPRVADLLART